MGDRFTLGAFAWRWLGALLLVFGSYNVAGVSYFHWILAGGEGLLALKVFVGLLLLAGWIVYLGAALKALGAFGFLLVAALFAASFWVLADLGLLPVAGARAALSIAQFILAGVLAVGVSWSHLRRRLSGQVVTDELED